MTLIISNFCCLFSLKNLILTTARELLPVMAEDDDDWDDELGNDVQVERGNLENQDGAAAAPTASEGMYNFFCCCLYVACVCVVVSDMSFFCFLGVFECPPPSEAEKRCVYLVEDWWLVHRTRDERANEMSILRLREEFFSMQAHETLCKASPLLLQRAKLKFLAAKLNSVGEVVPKDLETEIQELSQQLQVLKKEHNRYVAQKLNCRKIADLVVRAPPLHDPTACLNAQIVSRILMFLFGDDIKHAFRAKLHTLNRRWHAYIVENRSMMLYMAVCAHHRYGPHCQWTNANDVPLKSSVASWTSDVSFSDRTYIQYGNCLAIVGDEYFGETRIRYRTKPAKIKGKVKSVGFHKHGCVVLSNEDDIVVFDDTGDGDIEVIRIAVPDSVDVAVSVAVEFPKRAEPEDVSALRRQLLKQGQTNPATLKSYTKEELLAEIRDRIATNRALVRDLPGIRTALIRCKSELALIRCKQELTTADEARVTSLKETVSTLQAQIRQARDASEYSEELDTLRAAVIKQGVLPDAPPPPKVRVHVMSLHSDNMCMYSWDTWKETEKTADGERQGTWHHRNTYTDYRNISDIKIVTDGSSRVLITLNYAATNSKQKSSKSRVKLVKELPSGATHEHSTRNDPHKYHIYDTLFAPGEGFFAQTSDGMYFLPLDGRDWTKLTNTRTSSDRLTIVGTRVVGYSSNGPKHGLWVA